jgi:type VI secretion system VgrG family protein
MVLIRRASEADFTFTAEEYAEELRVLRFSGTEGISELFRYTLKLAALDSEIDFGTIIGKSACLNINGETGERYVNGIISRLIQSGTGNRYTIYNADLVPLMWLTKYRRGSRIFQNMTFEDIITRVFQDAGISSDYFRFALTGTHNSHEYCVQYRESEFNFVSRLMEEEGMFYYFEHNEDGHVMVIADNSAVHTPLESPTVIFNEASSMVSEEECIYEYRFLQQVRPGSTMLRDFNYESPTLSLDNMALGDEVGQEEENLEIYDYPGDYQDTATGSDLAMLRLEALRANRQVGLGKSVCRRFIPGYRFTLDRYTRSSFNQEYLITNLRNTGSQPLGEDMAGEGLQYNNDFECIPFSVPYRPLRKTPKPIVEGVQTAMVVGPGGDKIYFDDFARVKVQFHWDREGRNDENSSCWIRVSDGYAGQNHGIQFTPLVGDEVIVSFLEGDPDRPIITGRVYNGDNMPHLDPPKNIQNVIRTPYQHEILLDDKRTTIALSTGGKQQIHMTDGSPDDEFGNHISIKTSDDHSICMANGSKNQGIFIETKKDNLLYMDDMTKQIAIQTTDGHNIILDDQNKTISITSTGGNYIVIDDNNNTITTSDSSGQHKIAIDANGGISITCDSGNIELKAPAGSLKIDASDVVIKSSGNIGIQAGGEISMKAGTKISAKAPQVTVEAAAQAQIKSATVKIEGGLVEIKGGLIKLN